MKFTIDAVITAATSLYFLFGIDPANDFRFESSEGLSPTSLAQVDLLTKAFATSLLAFSVILFLGDGLKNAHFALSACITHVVLAGVFAVAFATGGAAAIGLKTTAVVAPVAYHASMGACYFFAPSKQ